jgi:hypothetical protein
MSKTEDKLDASMHILKTDSCKTLSGKSTLGYQIGRTPDAEIHLRVHSNSGDGFFSPEWITWEDIRRTLEKCPKGISVTSFVLQPPFRGKSVNIPAFLTAVLIRENVLCPLKGKQRLHVILDPKDFMARIEKWTASVKEPSGKPSGKPSASPPAKSTRKAAIRKQAAAKRKGG